MILLVVFLAGLFVGAAATALLLDSEWWTGGPKDPAWWDDDGDEPYFDPDRGRRTHLPPMAASVPRLLTGEVSRSECETCSHGDHYPEPCRELVPWGPGDVRLCDCHEIDAYVPPDLHRVLDDPLSVCECGHTGDLHLDAPFLPCGECPCPRWRPTSIDRLILHSPECDLGVDCSCGELELPSASDDY